jgi:hypothetical protein
MAAASLVWAILGAGALVLGVPVLWEHSRLENSIARLRTSHLDSLRAVEERAAYDHLLKRCGELEAKWDRRVTPSLLVGSLAELAARQGLKVLSQDCQRKESPVPCYRQTLTLQGSYRSWRGFLGALEDLPTLTEVSETRLDRAEAGIQGSLVVDTFSRSASPGDKP